MDLSIIIPILITFFTINIALILINKAKNLTRDYQRAYEELMIQKEQVKAVLDQIENTMADNPMRSPDWKHIVSEIKRIIKVL